MIYYTVQSFQPKNESSAGPGLAKNAESTCGCARPGPIFRAFQGFRGLGLGFRVKDLGLRV